jgi:hypothetical protein
MFSRGGEGSGWEAARMGMEFIPEKQKTNLVVSCSYTTQHREVETNLRPEGI